MQLNVTQLADKQNAQPHLIAVSLHLKLFNEFNQSHSECTLWPAVRDLLTNFTLPQDAPQPPAPPPP
ncbi:putative CRSP complex subunit [Operophtera brumata]|uniref:Putative CRSP complex subunit n=1 Tax=Operophtera brumata TaxID=104452 RepID=A0A0L7KQV8_OPEBR|nr:putative CRSP complex subunit [Operophtera brumata]